MASNKISVDEVPDALRVKWRNEFIVSALLDWRDGKGLQGQGFTSDLAKGEVDDFVAQMREFGRRHFPGAYDKAERADSGDASTIRFGAA